jgi:hypothetical protein
MLMRLRGRSDTGNKDGLIDGNVPRQFILMTLIGGVDFNYSWSLTIELDLPFRRGVSISARGRLSPVSVSAIEPSEGATYAAEAHTDGPGDVLASVGAKKRFNIASAFGRYPATAIPETGSHFERCIGNDIRG